MNRLPPHFLYVWKVLELREGYFIPYPQALILVNNKISKISPGAFSPLVKLERLYLSKNQLKELPEKMPKTLQELRAHENEITKVRKSVFNGLNQMIVIGTGILVTLRPGFKVHPRRFQVSFSCRKVNYLELTYLKPRSLAGAGPGEVGFGICALLTTAFLFLILGVLRI